MPASCRSGSAASGHVDHGQRYDAFSHDEHVLAVVAERDDEMVEVVLELGDDDAGLGGVHPDPAPVRVGGRGRNSVCGMTSASGYVTMWSWRSVIDSDQHLYETRTTWLDHIDPGRRDDALRIVDDELGYPWLSWGATASSARSTCNTRA